MATQQKAVNKNIRKITRVAGKSLAITLPKELVAGLKWKEKQKVKVSRVYGGLRIKDWKK